MALVKKNIEIVKFKEGESVEGFLLSATVIEMPPYNAGGAPGQVPKLVLQDEKGKKFSVLLGAAMISDVQELTPNAWTVVEKGKLEKGKKGNYYPYSLAQDDEKTL